MVFGVYPLPDVRRCSLSDRPRYREAYPCLSTGGAWRQSKQGRTIILWRDRDSYPVGAGEITWATRESLNIRFKLEERAYMRQAEGGQQLSVVWKGSMAENARPFAVCPDCARTVDILVHLEGWSCSRCLSLPNRSALLPEEVRWTEELHMVEAAIAVADNQRWAPRIRKQYDVRHDALTTKLAGRRAFASEMYSERVTSEWAASTPAAALLL